MFKQIFSLCIALALGCAHATDGKSGKQPDAFPIALSQQNVRATALTATLIRSEISSALRPGEPSTSFTSKDEIFFLVLLTWENPGLRRRFEPVFKWFANGEPYATRAPGEVQGMAPYHVWASHTAFSLGPGAHAVELWAGDNRLARAEFRVTGD